MPDYWEKELPEKHFLFTIVGTLHETELVKIIESAYQHRASQHKAKEEELIEITPVTKEFLKSVISYQSNNK